MDEYPSCRSHSEGFCFPNEFVTWESLLYLSNCIFYKETNRCKDTKPSFHSQFWFDRMDTWCSLFSPEWDCRNIFHGRKSDMMVTTELCIWWQWTNLICIIGRWDTLLHLQRLITCCVCIHIEKLFEVKGNKSTKMAAPLIYKVHLSLTHKLQNRDWVLWCQSKTCNYTWKCFMISTLCFCRDDTLSYCLEPAWQRPSWKSICSYIFSYRITRFT